MVWLGALNREYIGNRIVLASADRCAGSDQTTFKPLNIVAIAPHAVSEYRVLLG